MVRRFGHTRFLFGTDSPWSSQKESAARIRALHGPIHLVTYVSLSCTNCPDVVQALNLIALYHPGVTHDIADGALWPEETEHLGIQAVPTVTTDGQALHIGRGALGDLLGPCMFALCMGLSRLLFSLFGAKLRLRPSLSRRSPAWRRVE